MLLHWGLLRYLRNRFYLLLMPLKIHRLLQVLAGFAFLFCGLGIIDTMVSLKYETEVNACISTVDGRDLCHALHYNWVGLGGVVALVLLLAVVKVKPAKVTY